MADHCASSSWPELPWDLLDGILQRLELPGALAFASACASWRSAAAARGVPRPGTPWLVKTESKSTPGSEFRNLLDIHKAHMVSFPPGRRHLDWCGASHGWLVAPDELANLLLYNPFTSAIIPLPPITGMDCVKGVYDDDGRIVGYHYGHRGKPRSPDDLGGWFYLKVVLSCDPSRGDGDYTAMAIYGNAEVSFARAGESGWRVATTTTTTRTPCGIGEDFVQKQKRLEGMCADGVYHKGRFYTVTMGGAVEAWDLISEDEPKKEVIVAGDRRYMRILTRFLVSTPWGDLLEIRTLRRSDQRRKIKVEVLQVDVEEHRLVRLSRATAFRDHAVFVGLNESACLSAKEFPELRPNCVYFTTPWLTNQENFGLDGWRGVVIYHLESQTFEDVIDTSGRYEFVPHEVWFIPNI